MIEQWELARNLIDAKKALDSLWFISQHIQNLYHVRELCYDKRSCYYINVCAVLDKTVCKNGNDKRQLKQDDSIVMQLYTERDKHYAHKDKNYISLYPYASIEAESRTLQQDLQHIRDLCKDYFPDVITLDFVCYDGELFRRIEKISPKDEEQIKRQKYPLYNKPIVGVPMFSGKILYDIDDLKSLSDAERKEYCVTVDDGLTMEEGLQNRQDMCIKANVLYDQNMWVSLNKDAWDDCIEARKKGFFDKFGIIQFDRIWEAVCSGELSKPSDDELRKMMNMTVRI